MHWGRAKHIWDIGLLGDGRRPFKAEKRVRNPYVLPISWDRGLLGDGRRPLEPEKRVRNPSVLPISCPLSSEVEHHRDMVDVAGSIPAEGTNNASNCLMERQAPDKRPRGSSILPRSTNSRRTTWRWSPASQAGETSSKLVRGTKI